MSWKRDDEKESVQKNNASFGAGEIFKLLAQVKVTITVHSCDRNADENLTRQ
jgi:hypothetical protein